MDTMKRKDIVYVLLIALLGVAIVIFVRKPDDVQTQDQTNHLTHEHDFSQVFEEISNLESTIKSNPEDYDSHLKLAHLYQDTGQLEKSIKQYKLYLTKYPENADARIDLGVSYYQLAFEDEANKSKHFALAILEMEKALEYSPEHQLGHFNLGIVTWQTGDLEKSKYWFKKCISINPNSDIATKAMDIIKQHLSSITK